MDTWGARKGMTRGDQYIAIYGIFLRGHCEDQYGYMGCPQRYDKRGPIYCKIWDILAGPLRGPVWIHRVPAKI